MTIESSSLSSPHFLIIGNGRLARHLIAYLKLLNSASIHFSQWSRSQNCSLEDFLKTNRQQISHVLLAISDSALSAFTQDVTRLIPDVPIFHFSAATSVEGVRPLHPLMTFGPESYALSQYQRILFVTPIVKDELPPKNLNHFLPGLDNPLLGITKEQMPFYHSLCVMAGNFPMILWQHSLEKLQEMGVDKASLHDYLDMNLANFKNLGASALTGPLVRNDVTTIERNIESLEKFDGPYAALYRSFVEAFKRTSK